LNNKHQLIHGTDRAIRYVALRLKNWTQWQCAQSSNGQAVQQVEARLCVLIPNKYLWICLL